MVRKGDIMKGKRLLIAGITGFCVALLMFSTIANAHKYLRKTTDSSPDVMSAEKARSMSDCMTYSANHVSKGCSKDKSMFSKQFGDPIERNGPITSYNYDEYTKIILDCSKASCYCRCMQNR